MFAARKVGRIDSAKSAHVQSAIDDVTRYVDGKLWHTLVLEAAMLTIDAVGFDQLHVFIR
jgi:hypothetical protein